MSKFKSQNPIIRLYINLSNEQNILFFAFLSSIINRILDLAPPVIIGLAVDIVVKEEKSWIAGFGISDVPSQLILLALITGGARSRILFIIELKKAKINIFCSFDKFIYNLIIGF